jgi:hypothetical protein
VRAALGALVVSAAGAICIAAIACGGARPKSATTAASPAGAPRAEGEPRTEGDPRAEIAALDREIAGAMLKAHVPQPPTSTCNGAGCAAALSAPFATPTTTDLQCHPAATERCTEACTLSTSICRNQEKICNLARELAGDDWAANKCESARASCKAAHDSCCSCLA